MGSISSDTEVKGGHEHFHCRMNFPCTDMYVSLNKIFLVLVCLIVC